jgi:hypothetical protein
MKKVTKKQLSCKHNWIASCNDDAEAGSHIIWDYSCDKCKLTGYSHYTFEKSTISNDGSEPIDTTEVIVGSG